jgi:hypothetical protein
MTALRRGTIAVLVSLLSLTGAAISADAQQGLRDLPATNQQADRTLASGAVDEWLVDLAASEFLAVSVEPLARGELEEWPAVAVVRADGVTVFESTEPSIASGVDGSARAVVSLVTDRPGPYRLRIVARGGQLRYLLRVDERRPAAESDRRRIEAHQLWRDGMRRFTAGSPESLRAAVDTFEQALTFLEEVDDAEGQALTLGTIAAVW